MTTVGANSFKIYVTDAVYQDIPFDVNDQTKFNRYNTMAVYPELPSLFEVAAKPQENISGFLAELLANKAMVDDLLKNNRAVTFFAPQGNSLPAEFNLQDHIVAGIKTYDPASALGLFDNPAPALGVPHSFDVFQTGVSRKAVSGNNVTLLTEIPAYNLPIIPTYEINGTTWQIVSNNITFLYKDINNVNRQGLINTLQPYNVTIR